MKNLFTVPPGLLFFLLLFVCNNSQGQNNGSLLNGPSWSSGAPSVLSGYANSISFDGSDDIITPQSDLILSPGRSISVWFKLSTTSGQQVLFGNSNTYAYPDFGAVYISGNVIYAYTNAGSYSGFSLPVTVTSGTWYNVIIVNDGGTLRLYLDNTESSSGGSPVSDNFNFNQLGMARSSGSATYKFSGKMSDMKLFASVLSAGDRANIFAGNSTSAVPLTWWKMNEGSGNTVYDTQGGGSQPGEAQAFINAAGITNASHINAINHLVTDLKNAGIWNKMKAIYPFAGSTDILQKWNLKDPRDLDEAYRLTFHGGITHSATGAKWNGSTGYADTHCDITTLNMLSISYYSRSNETGSNPESLMGVYTTSDATQVGIQFTSDNVQAFLNDYAGSGNLSQSGISGVQGLWTATRTGASATALYKNGSLIISGNEPTNYTGSTGYSITLGRRNGAVNYYSTTECAFAAIGEAGLTATEASALNQAVQAYLTNLTSTPPPPTPTPSSTQWITSGNNIYNANTGNVGIGTDKITAPGYKLFVEGTIRARKLKIDTDVWPDFVFDKNYKLPSLAETEKFIKLNNHLPGIPSAEEVLKNGIDVGMNQALLLKKIEELTLIIIEQNKKINQQSKRLRRLELLKNKNNHIQSK